MSNKTKVIAFRVNEREYDAIMLEAVRRQTKIGEYVRGALVLPYLLNQLDIEVKRLEAKAKRAAKKAAKAAEAEQVPQ